MYKMKEKIEWWQYELTSFNGRLNRRNFITYLLGTVFCSIISFLLLGFIGNEFSSIEPLILLLIILLGIVAFIIDLSIRVRRLHDRNHSGYFVLFSFVPIVNIVLFFYLLCAPGSPEKNKYDPIEASVSVVEHN